MAPPSKLLQLDNPSQDLRFKYPTRYLTVVHIPINVPSEEPSARLKKVQLINVGLGGVPNDECNKFEKELGWIPDLRYTKNFNWGHRSLRGISQEDMHNLAGDWKADYMMYVCVDEPDYFRRNDRLEDIAEFDVETRLRTSELPFKTRGDAFVFKRVKKHGSEGSLGGYIDMDEEFVTSTDREEIAHIIIHKLVLYPTKRG